jgi:cobalamin biosynthesis protein CbiG
MQDVKFPHVEVELVGQDGNAYAILGAVTTALKRANVSKEDIDAYNADAMSGDYDNLLQVTLRTVTVN